jgi:hypothetical protein
MTLSACPLSFYRCYVYFGFWPCLYLHSLMLINSDRFLKAQEGRYDSILAELSNGQNEPTGCGMYSIQ